MYMYMIYIILYILYNILFFIVFIQLPPRPRIQDVQYLAENIQKYGFVRKCGTPNVMFIKSIIIVPMKKNVIFIRICWGLNPFLGNDTPTLHLVGLVFSSNPCTAGCPLLLHVATALGSLGQVPHASKDATAPGEVRCHVTLLGRGWGAVGFGDQFRTLS